jgi:hypothetical protein
MKMGGRGSGDCMWDDERACTGWDVGPCGVVYTDPDQSIGDEGMKAATAPPTPHNGTGASELAISISRYTVIPLFKTVQNGLV